MDKVLEWFEMLVRGFAGAGDYLYISNIRFGEFEFSPILLFTFSGLIVYVSIAVGMWFLK